MRNVLFLPLLAIQALLMATACTESSDQSLFNTVASVELTSIRNDLEIYSSLAVNRDDDESRKLKLKVAQSILRHVMLIRTINPEIESLRGEPLETICLLTEPEARKILNEAGDPQLAGLAHEYLLRIEPEVRKRIEKVQKTMRGRRCYITPEINEITTKIPRDTNP